MDVKRDGKKLKLPDPGGPSVAKDGPMFAFTGGAPAVEWIVVG